MTDRNKTRILKALSRLDRAESELNFLINIRLKSSRQTPTVKGILYDIKYSLYNIRHAKTLITNLNNYKIQNRKDWVNWKNGSK